MERQTKENLVASFVDIASIVLAYQIGVSRFGIFMGVGYGIFDAWIVIWQRERILLLVHRGANAFRRIPAFRRKNVLPWALE